MGDELIIRMDPVWRHGRAFTWQHSRLRFGIGVLVLSRVNEDSAIPIQAVKTIKLPCYTEEIISGGLNKGSESCAELVQQLEQRSSSSGTTGSQ